MPDEFFQSCPDCVCITYSPILGFCLVCGQEDEWYTKENQQAELGPLRRWRVTVTLEYIIDHLDCGCDPEVCPIQVTARKRVTFLAIEARAEWQAEERALDRFERTHKVGESASWWRAEARVIEPK